MSDRLMPVDVPTLATLLALPAVPHSRIGIDDVLAVRRQESRRAPEILLRDCQLAFTELLRLGWRLEAAGDDALLFSKGGSSTVLRFAQNWPAYQAFVTLARQAGSTHFPRFLRWEAIGRASLALVERLQPVIVDRVDWTAVNQAAELAHRLADGRPGRAQTDTLDVEIIAAARMLGTGARDGYYALDLGIENILMRPATGEVVFNDPWSEWGE